MITPRLQPRHQKLQSNPTVATTSPPTAILVIFQMPMLKPTPSLSAASIHSHYSSSLTNLPSQTHPNQPIYQGQPPLCYPLAAAPAIEQPSAHHVWYGRTKEQVDAENIAIAQKVGTNKPVQLVPYNPSGEQQFWCRELDSSYTLRTSKDITENLQPGFWQYAQPGGYPYWYRMKK